MNGTDLMLIMAGLADTLNGEGIDAEFKDFGIQGKYIVSEISLGNIDSETVNRVISILESSGFKPLGKVRVNYEGEKTAYFFEGGGIDLYFIVQDNGESVLSAALPMTPSRNDD